VPFARIGARLPGNFKIKKSKLRGVESHGMLCSASELQLSEESDGLHELPSDAPLGETLQQYLGLDDRIIEIDLTPNRGDCLSIRGVARELSARNNLPLQTPAFEPVAITHDETFPVEIASDSCCAHFFGRVIKGINPNATSPLWLVEKLRRCGIRSISPAVDVTNYVMMELGQPMHAFDRDKLNGGIRVRLAEQGEKVTLLDGREVQMDNDTTMITDHQGAVAIAGIMGGDATGVTGETQNVLLEAALFTPLGIAGKPRRYNAYTDSAQRFERGVDSGLQHQAIERASQILMDIVGGEAGPVFEVRNDGLERQFNDVVLRRERLDKFLGVAVPDDTVTDVLTRLGIEITASGQGWVARSPSYRYDIAIEEDLIEEIARVHGYSNIPRTNPAYTPEISAASESVVAKSRIQQVLVNRGYQEAVCYSFVDEKLQQQFDPDLTALPLANPISADMGVMRTSLWCGLSEVLTGNLNRQQSEVRIFETGLKFVPQGADLKQQNVLAGLVFAHRGAEHWSETTPAADFYDVKADVEALLDVANSGTYTFEKAEHPALHPGITARILCDGNPVGWIGAMHPKLQKTLDLSQSPILFELEMSTLQSANIPAFVEFSKFPTVRRDLAVTVDESVSYMAIEQCVKRNAPETLIDVKIIDVYTGEGITKGLKSVALGLILQDFSSTLGDEEIDSAMSQILNGLTAELGAALRN
jgi:phenylalanyl-tRNA synthetase beta chain